MAKSWEPHPHYFHSVPTCQELRPVLIILELAPLTPTKVKDDKTNHENSKVTGMRSFSTFFRLFFDFFSRFFPPQKQLGTVQNLSGKSKMDSHAVASTHTHTHTQKGAIGRYLKFFFSCQRTRIDSSSKKWYTLDD